MENIKVELYSKGIIEEKLPLYEFYYTYGEFLIDVNDADDTESGLYRLFPEEKERVEDYIKRGFDVATIWEQGDTDIDELVSFGYENSYNHPFVTGFFILKLLNR